MVGLLNARLDPPRELCQEPVPCCSRPPDTYSSSGKPSYGLGNYYRGQTEHVLFGVRGSQGLARKDVGTLLLAPRGPGGHSSKPDEFYALVESCSPAPRLSIFERRTRPGWTSWGEGGVLA